MIAESAWELQLHSVQVNTQVCSILHNKKRITNRYSQRNRNDTTDHVFYSRTDQNLYTIFKLKKKTSHLVCICISSFILTCYIIFCLIRHQSSHFNLFSCLRCSALSFDATANAISCFNPIDNVWIYTTKHIQTFHSAQCMIHR